MLSKTNKEYMKIAISLAKDRIGLTGENPAVGCVIVKNNKIISTGQTGINGVPHAEQNAIDNARESLNNSNLFVSLEPCSHFGKTPPCTNSIIKNKIKNVFYGMEDIDKRSKNKCIKILDKRGIFVKSNFLKKEAKKIYKSYIHIKKYNLPYVTGKIACSKNYIINSKNKYLTNDHSLKVSHLLRYKNQGILISYKTLNKDNPLLNCRLSGLEKFSPIRFVIDKNLDIKLSSKIVKTSNKYKTIVYYNKKINKKKKINYLKKKNIKLVNIPVGKSGNFSLKEILLNVKKNGVNYLLIEGGKNLTFNFLKENLINEFMLFRTNYYINHRNSTNIKNIISYLNRNFNNTKNVSTFLEEDQILKFY